MTAVVAPRAGSRRGVALGAGVLAVVVALAVLASGGQGRRSGPALSPRSDLPDGTSALVLLLGELGARAEVTVGSPPADADTALLLRDSLADDQRAELRRWVERGGTLVVADDGSPLAARTDRRKSAGAAIERGSCSTPGLDSVERIATAEVVAGLVLGAPARFEAPSEGTACFDRYVVTRRSGSGTIVSIGGPEPFVNALLATDDGAALAVDLLAPKGNERVAVIDVVPAAGQGSDSLIDLVAPRVKQALAAAFVAFVVYALYRGRRLGQPVVEHQPIALPGSGLVAAVGHLQQRSGSSGRAAGALRADVRRAVAGRFGLPASSAPETIAGVVADRTGLDAERVRAALGDHHIPDERSLVALT
ncbi:MAG: DUF4350 domain-containing protein, partial [Acidimicrobiales bacterium]